MYLQDGITHAHALWASVSRSRVQWDGIIYVPNRTVVTIRSSGTMESKEKQMPTGGCTGHFLGVSVGNFSISLIQ